MQAVSHAITLDWDLNEQEMVPLAKRIADGDIDYGDDLPDPDTYDASDHPGRGGRTGARPEPGIPETQRRRADTIAKSEHIMALSKHLTLTRSVLAGTLARGHARPARSSSSTGTRTRDRQPGGRQTRQTAEGRRLPGRQDPRRL